MNIRFTVLGTYCKLAVLVYLSPIANVPGPKLAGENFTDYPVFSLETI